MCSRCVNLLIMAAVFGLFCAAALAAFAPALKAGFVFDDNRLIVENPAVKSIANIPQMFARAFSGNVYTILPTGQATVDPGYRPVRFASYALDYRIGGLKPSVFHLSNLLHHALAAFLLFVLLRHFGFSTLPSFLGGLIFLLHPLNSECACYITARKDILCAIFYFAAFVCYIRWRRNRSRICAAAVFPLFIAAFFAKEAALTLPFAILLWELLRHRKPQKLARPLRILVPLIALSVLLTVLQLLFKNLSKVQEVSVAWWGGSITSNMLTVPRLLLFYLRLVFVPYPLSADYSHNAFPASSGLLTPPTTLLALLSLAALIGFAFYAWRRRWFIPAFCILLFLGTLVPVSQIYPLPERLAERFLYLPLMAVAVGAAFVLQRLRRKHVAFGALAAVLAACVAADFRRSRDWKDELTLFSAAADAYPNCARAHIVVGQELLARKKPKEALRHLKIAHQILKTAPQDPWLYGLRQQSQCSTAEALIALKRYRQAASILKKLLLQRDFLGRLIIHRPEYLYIPFNLASCLLAQGLTETAWEVYEVVVHLARGNLHIPKVRTHFVFALHKMAMIAGSEGDHRCEVRLLREAVSAAKGTDHEPVLRLYLAQALLKAGECDAAIAEANKAAALVCSALITSHNTLKPLSDKPLTQDSLMRVVYQAPIIKASALRASGAPDAAIQTLRKSLQTHFSEWAVCELARCLLITDKPKQAQKVLEDALRKIGRPHRPEFFRLLQEARRQVQLRDPAYIAKRIRSALNAAKSLIRRGKKEAAQDLLKKALRLAANLTPQTRNIWQHLAQAHLLLLSLRESRPSKGDLLEGERLLKLAEKEGSDVSILWLGLGGMWAELGDVDKAVSALRRSDLPRAHFDAAFLLLKTSRNDEALSELKKCVECGYRKADALYHMGMLLARMKRYGEARDALCGFLSAADRDDPRRGVVEALLQSDPKLKGNKK